MSSIMDVMERRIHQIQSQTHFNKLEFEHTWTIEDFSLYGKPEINTVRVLKSNIFPNGDDEKVKWQLELESKTDGYVYVRVLSISQTDYDDGLYIKSQITLVNKANEKKSLSVEIYKKITNESSMTGFHFYKPSIFEDNLGFLPRDKLTVACKIQVIFDSVNASKVSSFQCSENNTFQKFYESKFLCDVTLCVGDKRFPAHKIILAQKSPVFAAMFEHEMAERASNRVNIVDMDHRVVSEMLQFIYTGKADGFDDIAAELLAAANKYEMQELKNACEKKVFLTVNKENAIDVLILADLHNALRLKALVMEFIQTHKEEIMKTTQWKSMVQKKPNLGVEVLQYMIDN